MGIPPPGRHAIGSPRSPVRIEDVAFDDEPSLRLRVRAVNQCSVESLREGSVWRAESNRAEREIAPGLDERLTARDGCIDWEFVAARKAGAAGPLVVDVEVQGPDATEGEVVETWPARLERGVLPRSLGRDLLRARLADGRASRS